MGFVWPCVLINREFKTEMSAQEICSFYLFFSNFCSALGEIVAQNNTYLVPPCVCSCVVFCAVDVTSVRFKDLAGVRF